MLQIKFKRITIAATLYYIFCRHTPPPTLGMGSTFSEHGHVEYQIQENHECSNMVPNILPADPDPGDGSIGKNSTFSEYGDAAYQIKGNH